jgi:hypothetical protein
MKYWILRKFLANRLYKYNILLVDEKKVNQFPNQYSLNTSVTLQNA